jgi:hypothetical protein
MPGTFIIVQVAFTRRAPFPATPHVGFSARPLPPCSGLASSPSGIVSCAIPQQELPPVAALGALVNYIVRTVRRSTTSLSFPTAVRSPQLASADATAPAPCISEMTVPTRSTSPPSLPTRVAATPLASTD